MTKNYEKPTKGKLYEITVKQHIYPKRIIENFCDENGTVDVKRIKGESFRVKPNNPIFCAIRTWDQRAEQGWMKSIEDKFHKTLDELISNQKITDHYLITEYYFLWYVKTVYDRKPPANTTLRGISPSDVTEEQKEIIESKHGMYIGGESQIESRFIVSMIAQRDHDIWMSQHGESKWTILKAKDRFFIAPKYCPKYMIHPISPNIILAANLTSEKFESVGVIQTNKLLASNEFDCIFTKNMLKAIG